MNNDKATAALALVMLVTACGGGEESRCNEFCSNVCSNMRECKVWQGSGCESACNRRTGSDEFSKLSCITMEPLIRMDCDALSSWTTTWSSDGWYSFPEYTGSLKLDENECFPGMIPAESAFRFKVKIFRGTPTMYMESDIVATPSSELQSECELDDDGTCTWTWKYPYTIQGTDCKVDKTDSIAARPDREKLGGAVSVDMVQKSGNCAEYGFNMPCRIGWSIQGRAESPD